MVGQWLGILATEVSSWSLTGDPEGENKNEGVGVGSELRRGS
jgi:hypothetical protein